MIWYVPANVNATSSYHDRLKFALVLPFWCQFTQTDQEATKWLVFAVYN